MKKNRILIVIFYLIWTLVIYGENKNEILIKSGKNLREWLSDEDVNGMYNYLSGARIDLEKITRNPYFYKKDKEGNFFLEIDGDFRELKVADRGFITDKFIINNNTYSVKYRPNYNEIAIVYTDKKIYLSNKLEIAYLNIERIDENKKELASYFDENDLDFNVRQIVYSDKKTIYGISYLEAIEKKDGLEEKQLYFNKFSIDSSEKIDKSKKTKVLIDYPEVALVLMETIPDISLNPLRIEKILDGRIKGALTLGDTVVIKNSNSKNSMDVEDIKDLYNEGVFERIGIKSSSEEGVDFFEIPFFENRKYVFVEDEWTFISENLDNIKHIKSEKDKEIFLRELNALLEF